MAAIVCHGLKSCLESHQLVESRALTLSLPFSSKPHQQNPIDLPFKTSFWDSNSKTQERNSNKTDTNTGGGWSFLQALSNVSHVSKESSTEKESVYVHPQVKRSSTAMSQKSLELCTEKLGNETGSDIVDENNYGYDMDLLCSSPTREQEARPRHQGCLGGGRRTRNQNFPPPLTTMRGSESLRVRSHREDGRLVAQAIRVPPSASCFQAERRHGRLRLCFLKNHDDYSDPEEMQARDEEECESDGEDGERRKEMEDAKEEEEEEEEETEEEGEEMRRKEYERPRRCREGSKHENYELLNNWVEHLSLAIS